MSKIWVIGGTVETYKVSEKLINQNKDIIITVATDYGYEEFIQFKDYLVKGRMDKEKMIRFCKKYDISNIIDVSHPYAKEVSKNAIDTANDLGINYYRYERDDILDNYNYDKIYYVKDHNSAIELIKKLKFKRIFLTTGINNANEYIDSNFEELFIRILPRSNQIKQLEEKGYKSKNIIAMQGPFSKQMNIATINHINADVMITKQSGKEGGFDEKVGSCIDTGISIIIIKRPDINYENKYNDIDIILSKIILGDE